MNQMWILKNSKVLLEYIQSRPLSSCNSIKTFDFSTLYTTIPSAGFTYRLSRLKPRAPISRRPPAKVYNILDIVIDLSYTCCHDSSVVFLALHFRIILSEANN